MAYSGAVNWRRAPATCILIGTLVLSALCFWATQARSLVVFAMGPDAFQQPWRLLTYAWTHSPLGDGLSIIFFAFLCFWIYSIGPSLEQSLGSIRFAVIWLIAVLLGGIAFATGAQVMHLPAVEVGPWLPTSALTIIWAARNQSATLNLYGIIPVSGRVLAILTAVVDVFLLGSQSPLIGIIATLPLGLWWMFGNNQIPFAPFSIEKSSRLTDRPVMRGIKVYDDKYYDDVKDREIEREEKERLRRLFEGPPK
jgi:membrane associated rhomboid family serine protease